MAEPTFSEDTEIFCCLLHYVNICFNFLISKIGVMIYLFLLKREVVEDKMNID